jgi:hypothetical protein
MQTTSVSGFPILIDLANGSRMKNNEITKSDADVEPIFSFGGNPTSYKPSTSNPLPIKRHKNGKTSKSRIFLKISKMLPCSYNVSNNWRF